MLMFSIILQAAVTISILFNWPGKAQSTEIAPAMGRSVPLADSLTQTNTMMNQWISMAALASNREDKTCDPRKLRRRLLDLAGGATWTKAEKHIETSENISKNMFQKHESVYRDFTIFESPAIFFVSLAPVITVNGYYIGTDKIGHFIQTGFEYFRKAVIENKGLAAALAYGHRTETYHLGLLTGGIYSYGDLAANYAGLLFWQQFTDPEDGYLACRKDTWVQIRDFNWNRYVDSSWDELINCNRYGSEKMARKVNKNLHQLAMQCPASPEECTVLNKKYGDISRHILHPACHKTTSRP